jgi:hypothetical protein
MSPVQLLGRISYKAPYLDRNLIRLIGEDVPIDL